MGSPIELLVVKCYDSMLNIAIIIPKLIFMRCMNMAMPWIAERQAVEAIWR